MLYLLPSNRAPSPMPCAASHYRNATQSEIKHSLRGKMCTFQVEIK